MSNVMLSDAIEIDDERDIVTIYGIRYAGELFRGLGFKVDPRDIFQIINRNDSVLTLQVTRSEISREEIDDV